MNYTRRDLSMYVKFNTINMNGKKFRARRLGPVIAKIEKTKKFFMFEDFFRYQYST
jgi:hypothetical protein